MSKRGENIYKRKDGRWEGRYIKEYGFDGKAKYGYVYGKTYSETKQKLLNAQNKYIASAQNRDGKSISFNEALTLWLSSAQRNVKEATYARYHHLVETHIRPDLGVYRLDRIGTLFIEDYINKLLVSGRVDGTGGLSAKTTTDILTIVKSTIEYAQHLGYSVTCNADHTSIKKKEKPIRVLSVVEQQQLERVLLSNTDLIKFGVLLSLYTGIRLGELCALRWGCFDFNTGTMQIRETMQRIQNVDHADNTRTKIVFTPPKTKNSVRVIPLPPSILLLAASFKSAPNAFILTGTPERYIEPRTMQNHFKKLIQESKIANANYHALRHTFATRCVEVGFELKSLSEILGHSTVNITLNRYVHSSFDLKRENMNKLTLQEI